MGPADDMNTLTSTQPSWQIKGCSNPYDKLINLALTKI